MIHLKRFNENKKEELSIYNVMMYIMNIVDEYTVSFIDSQGYDMSPSEIKKDTNFNFIDKKFNKITADFDIIIYNKGPKGIDYGINYETYTEICSEMLSLIDYLKDNEWFLTEHKSESKFDKELLYKSISYNFKMPSEEISNDKSLQDHFEKDKIVNIFSSNGITIKSEDISFNDNGDKYNTDFLQWIEIEDYDVDYDLENYEVNDKITDICTELGGDFWDFLYGRNGIKIVFEE